MSDERTLPVHAVICGGVMWTQTKTDCHDQHCTLPWRYSTPPPPQMIALGISHALLSWRSAVHNFVEKVQPFNKRNDARKFPYLTCFMWLN